MSKRVRSFFAVLSLFVLCAALAIAASATGLSSHRNSCTSTRASAYIESKNCHPGYVVTTGRVEGRYMPITNPSASPGYVYQSGTGAATCSPGVSVPSSNYTMTRARHTCHGSCTYCNVGTYTNSSYHRCIPISPTVKNESRTPVSFSPQEKARTALWLELSGKT